MIDNPAYPGGASGALYGGGKNPALPGPGNPVTGGSLGNMTDRMGGGIGGLQGLATLGRTPKNPWQGLR